MSSATMYGQLKSEKVAEENETCRKIVREVAHFGVSERQRLMLIYLLALELENTAVMQAITTQVRELSDEMFIIDQENHDGSSNKSTG